MNINETKEELLPYIAVIVYESSSDSPHYESLYEESFVLIKAPSQESAQQEALGYAQKQRTSYKNEQQDTINWTVKHIVDVSPLLNEHIKFDNGAEIYSRYFRSYQAYISFEAILSGGL